MRKQEQVLSDLLHLFFHKRSNFIYQKKKYSETCIHCILVSSVKYAKKEACANKAHASMVGRVKIMTCKGDKNKVYC